MRGWRGIVLSRPRMGSAPCRETPSVCFRSWWAGAGDVGDIAEVEIRPEATTYDGQLLEDHRRRLEVHEFVTHFKRCAAHLVPDLASPLRSTGHIRGRIELTMLAVARCGLRSCDVAKLLDEARTSVTRWLTFGLRLEHIDPAFRDRLDTLDKGHLRVGRQQCDYGKRGTVENGSGTDAKFAKRCLHLYGVSGAVEFRQGQSSATRVTPGRWRPPLHSESPHTSSPAPFNRSHCFRS